MKQVNINGKPVPAIGQGTWHIGDDPKLHDREVEALRTGIENGMTLIDTAEMYGYGKSELVVGDAIKPYDRKTLFIVSKVLPQSAGKRDMRRSCEESLKRLGTDYLDLYLYHWRGSIPLSETVNCLQGFKDAGLIREWGVSNFDTSDMHELSRLKHSGKEMPAEIILIGGASLVINYGFREMTYDMDAAIDAWSLMMVVT